MSEVRNGQRMKRGEEGLMYLFDQSKCKVC